MIFLKIMRPFFLVALLVGASAECALASTHLHCQINFPSQATTTCRPSLRALSASSALRPVLRLRGGVTAAQPVVSTQRVITSPAAVGGKLRGGGAGGLDFGLLACFAGWFLGNYFYTLNNKRALNAAGGATGFPVTVCFLQMIVGSIYALFLWLAPDARTLPAVTPVDLLKVLPVAICAAGAHVSSMISMNLGAVSFSQIVKAAEPAFAALVGVSLYGKSISRAKWLCLIPVIGGVCLASITEVTPSQQALSCTRNLAGIPTPHLLNTLRNLIDHVCAHCRVCPLRFLHRHPHLHAAPVPRHDSGFTSTPGVE